MSKPGERHFEPEERGQIILEAVTAGDKAVRQKYRISSRTLRRWRSQLKDGKSPQVAESVRKKREALDQVWADKIPGCLDGCVRFIQEATKKLKRDDPAAVREVATAMKQVSEVAALWKVIDARVSQYAGKDGATDRPVPSASNVTPIRRPA